jgi:hemerythrin superfamily protein
MDEAITLAMEISLAEEETRKQRLKELDEAEDEALKLALEASLQLAKE